MTLDIGISAGDIIRLPKIAGGVSWLHNVAVSP